MKSRKIWASVLIAISIPLFAFVLNLDEGDTRDFAFVVAVIPFALAAGLFLGKSLKKKEVIVDGQTHRIGVWYPSNKPEFVLMGAPGSRIRVYGADDGIYAVEERHVVLMYADWWEATEQPRDAPPLMIRIHQELFKPGGAVQA